MTQYAETRVLRLGGTCLGEPQPFGTVFGKCQGYMGTVGFHSLLPQEMTQLTDPAAETQYFMPFNKH